MIFKKPAVTMLDKQKAKKTSLVFGVLAAVFSSLAIVAGIIMPKSKTLHGINNNSDTEFNSALTIKEGKEYTAISSDVIQRYDMDTNKMLGEYPYASKIKEMVSKNGVELDKDFLLDQYIEYQSIDENSGYFLCFDVYGDLFKINIKNDDFSLDSSFYLVDRYTLNESNGEKTYINTHKIRSTFIDGSDLYTLAINNNIYTINKFKLNDLASGLTNSKQLYRFVKPSKNQYVTIEDNYYNNIDTENPLFYSDTPFYISDPIINDSNGENPYELYVEDGKVSVLTSLGIHTYDKDFNDFDEINVLNNTHSQIIEKERQALLEKTPSELLAFGISNELYNSLSTACDFTIESLFKIVFEEDYFTLIKSFNKEIVKNVSNKNWLAYYDPTITYLSCAVFEDKVKNASNVYIDKGGTNSLGGMAYSPIQKTVYFINIKDNNLYQIKGSLINSLKVNTTKTLASLGSVTGINFGNKQFFQNHGALSYDKLANSLHVLFLNDQDLSIIDIKNDEIKVRTTLSVKYDIAGFSENKSGDKLMVVYKTSKVTIKNVTTSQYKLDIVDATTHMYKGLFIGLTIVFAVLAIACLVVTIISFKASKQDKTLLKAKTIKRDFKRNKWTYVSLIPFIVLLIMFCYVEAVGSISFSFFSYTMEHPTYIWNDFGNYISIFNDPDFWRMFGNTFFFLAFDLILGIIPPILFAFFLSIIKRKKLSGVLRALMFIPAIVPGIASLLIWRFGIFGDNGVLNSLVCLLRFGSTTHEAYEPIKFLADSSISRWSLLLIGFPYVGGYLIFYGGLMNIPNDYHEACKLEGMGVVKTFFKVDLPLIKPQIKYILVMAILSSAQNYERTYMLGSTGTTTLVESMYRQMKDYSNYGKASAYATIIFLLLIIPILINFKDTKKNNLGDQI